MSDDWKADLLADLPQRRIAVKAHTYDDAYVLIQVAAYNRRMSVQDFIGRAALAVAVADSKGEHSWREMTRLEPPMRDLRRNNLPYKRKFGEDFGPWKITGME